MPTALKNKAGQKGKNSGRTSRLRPKLKVLRKVEPRKDISPRTAKEKGATTAQNLEERFDNGDSVLDYFDLTGGRIQHPS